MGKLNGIDRNDINIEANTWSVIKLTVVIRFGNNVGESGITLVIPMRSNQRQRGQFNRGLYRERNRV